MLTSIKQYEGLLSKASSPISLSNHQTCVVLEQLYEKKHLLKICENAFGPLDAAGVSPGTCYWLDEANQNPNSKEANLLFDFLSPRGKLCQLLEELTEPCEGDMCRWNDPTTQKEEGKKRYTIDMPTKHLCTGYVHLISETEPDMSCLPRERAPPAFFVPFWTPPFVNREGPGSTSIQNALPTEPLPYFIIRMLMYIVNRAHHHGPNIVADEKPTRMRQITDTIDKTLSYVLTKVPGFTLANPSVDFPFFEKLLGAYREHYFTGAVLTTLVSRKRVSTIRFDTSDVIGASLIFLPHQMWLQQFRQPSTEHQRRATKNPSTLAEIVSGLRHLKAVYDIICKGGHVRRGNEQQLLRASPRDDITCADSVVYRSLLSGLRTVLMSLQQFPLCKGFVLETCVDVWECLLGDSLEFSQDPATLYAAYEAATVVCLDFLTTIGNSCFAAVASPACLQKLASIFEKLSSERVRGAFEAMAATADGPSQSALRPHLALNWARGDDNDSISIPSMFSSDGFARARKACASLSRASRVDAAAQAVSRILDGVQKLYPSLGDVSQVDTSLVSTPLASHRTVRKTRASKTLDDEDRELLLHGNASPAAADEVDGITFSRKQSIVLGSAEIPALVQIVVFLEALIESLMKELYAGYLPHDCHGNPLELVSHGGLACDQNPDDEAVWYCRETSQLLSQGSVVLAKQGPLSKEILVSFGRTQSTCCSKCTVLIRSSDVAVQLDGKILCRFCALRPWPRVSLRFAASQQFVFVAALAFLWLMFF